MAPPYALYDRIDWELYKNRQAQKPPLIAIMSDEELRNAKFMQPLGGPNYFAKKITNAQAEKLKRQYRK